MQFQDVTQLESSDTLTFQAVLYPDGKIQLRYHTLNGVTNSCSVGVQDSSGSQGVQVVYNGSYLQNQMAVEIRPDISFLTVTPLSGSVPAHSIGTLAGSFKSLTLVPSVYHANVEISHDAAGISPQRIPARLEVENLTGTIALTSPESGYSTLEGQNIAFAATASDPEGVARVEFYHGAVKFAEDLTTPFSSSSRDLPVGMHSVIARLVDVFGQTMDSAPRIVHVIADSDRDEMPDEWELDNGLDPGDPADAALDGDHDGFSNLEEYTNGTDPNFAEDGDGDGVPDEIEPSLIYRTSDGLWGYFDPERPDTDENDTLDGDEDYDKDGLTTLQELAAGTDANISDTDRDGVNDGKEIALGTDPKVADAWYDAQGVPRDSDDDGLSDILEIAIGTDPFDDDTNGNGMKDGEELDNGGNPRDPGPPPPPLPSPSPDPEPDPDPPISAPAPLSPASYQILVETKNIAFQKYGHEPFQTLDPPKRFLKMISDQSFKGGCPESGPEGVTGTLTATIDPVTGEESSDGDDYVNTGGEPQSPVRAEGSNELSDYDDPPNDEADCTGTVSYHSILSDENTTDMMVSNGKDALEDFEGGEALQPGTPYAYRNVHDNELSFEYQKAQFKFKWNEGTDPNARRPLTYLLIFTPEDDPDTSTDESANTEIVQTIQWDGLADESSLFTIDPDSKKSGADGKYTIHEVQIQVRNTGSWQAASELKVAKWETAWDSTGGFRNDFIDSFAPDEADRIRIRIDAPLPEGSRAIQLSTTGAGTAKYNDDSTAITLTEDPGASGFPSDGFVSKPMILVADTSDNRFQNDNAQNDQTHIVALGSHVEFRLGTATMRLPVKKKGSVNVTSYILTPNGLPDNNLVEKALNDIEVAREIYTQIGLEITSSVECVPIPAGVDLSDGLLLDTDDTRGVLSAEALAVLNSYATPGNQEDVVAIYVDDKIHTAATASGLAQGMAFPRGWSNGGNFRGTFVVSMWEPDRAVWSHELGHVLLNGQGGDTHNHYDEPCNLMRSHSHYTDSYHGDTKRLVESQGVIMIQSTYIDGE